MKNIRLKLIVSIFVIATLYSQVHTDSLVKFSDLKYHLEIEKQTIWNFVNSHPDTFALAVAIDDDISDAIVFYTNRCCNIFT